MWYKSLINIENPCPPNRDQTFYAGDIRYFEPENRGWLDNHIAVLDQYVALILPSLQAVAADRRGRVRFVELGAGTCLTSLSLKRHFPEGEFTCVDISLARMQQLIDKGANFLDVKTDHIDLVECDFSAGLPFDDARFDIVVFDASLHHSRNIWFTLEECARILTSDGAIVALREQYLAPLTAKYALDRLMETPEVKAGVSENAYLKEQYEYYFRTAQFEPKFYPVSPGRFRLLSFLNGIAFSKWSVFASKKHDDRNLAKADRSFR